MNKSGSIVIIDDDVDDHEILQEIFKELGLPNEVKYFEKAQSAIDYLSLAEIDPFIIVSDLHLHEVDGFQLHEMLKTNEAIVNKNIPLIFVTTGTTKDNLLRVYKLSTQGTFYKPPHYDQWKILLKNIYDYWQGAIIP